MRFKTPYEVEVVTPVRWVHLGMQMSEPLGWWLVQS